MKKLTCALLVAILAIGCKDKDECPAGFSGENCDMEIVPQRVDLEEWL